MRLQLDQTAEIKRLTAEQFGPDASVYLFGSRTDDNARGGDVDLLVETSHPVDQPALASARLAARISRQLNGRRVDVILGAPNLAQLSVHRIARAQGQVL